MEIGKVLDVVIFVEDTAVIIFSDFEDGIDLSCGVKVVAVDDGHVEVVGVVVRVDEELGVDV